MILIHRSAAALSLLAACLLSSPAQAEFQDRLERPALSSPLAPRSLLLGIARAGDRLVSVGARGHILTSDDGGKSWEQSAVPVSSDLTAVAFPTPELGWAVGHDGVVLASKDGGRSWVKQLDGIAAAKLMAERYHSEEAERFVTDGPDKPFLDVWFADAQTGYVVGAFNLIFTTHDGGQNWEPLYLNTENPQRLHLHAIRPAGDFLYIVGENGLVLRSRRGAEDFKQVAFPYKGSLFGITAGKNAILVYGLRGNLFASHDQGASWKQVAVAEHSALVGGTVGANDRIALVAQSGAVLESLDGGNSFSIKPGAPPMPLCGVAENSDGQLVLIGFAGASLGNKAQ
jgi:photosystem II stability/assembly factor-like uncharacterized protein